MKLHQTSGDDEALRRTLREWTVDAPLPPRFQERVWERIARAETEAPASLWPALSRLVEVVLPRPGFALPYVAVLLALGVAAGSLAAQARTRRVQTDLGLRYVQSVDPYRTGVSHP
jgi:hypothetical protein